MPENEDNTKQPGQGENKGNQDNSGEQGQSSASSQDNKGQAPSNSNLPEKLRGKSADEIASMYSELESKFGEQSRLVGEHKTLSQQIKVLNEVFLKKPELFKEVERSAKELYGRADDSENNGKGDGEDKKPDPKLKEVTTFNQSQIIQSFKKDYGIIDLAKADSDKIMEKVVTELCDLVDSSGSMTIKEVLDTININRLPEMLKKAYWLAQKDLLMDKGSVPADLSSIGALLGGSSSQKSSSNGLTEDERKTSKNLGISEEDYLKNKKKS